MRVPKTQRWLNLMEDGCNFLSYLILFYFICLFIYFRKRAIEQSIDRAELNAALVIPLGPFSIYHILIKIIIIIIISEKKQSVNKQIN